MAHAVLPFTLEEDQKLKSRQDVISKLPEELRNACQKSPVLAEYVRRLPLDEIGIPSYYEKPSRKLSDLEYKNLIYPIPRGLFIHIYPDFMGMRNHHVAIEPITVVKVDHLIKQVDAKLIFWAEELGRIEDKDEKETLLLRLIDNMCTMDASTIRNKKKPEKILVTPEELEALKYLIIRDKIGLGVLQPLLLDPNIEDISCSGVGHIFIEHKIFKSVQSSIYFANHAEVDEFVIWLGEWIKSPVTVRNPLVDSVLPDGSRINIVYGQEISKRGSNFTIRKFSGTPISVFELIEFGSLNYLMASYLSFMLEEGMNMFVVGATASGKTTLLNALNTFIKPDAKIVTIEDTPEVYVPHHNWIQEQTRHMGADNKGGEVGMFELLKAALRQRPDRIIVGEIRSVEAVVAFQAMQTGHGVISTFHAATVEKLIQRLTGEPINIPKTYIDNLNLAVIQQAVRLPDGRGARRVMSINEIIGYDPVSESFSFLEAFRWDPANDVFEFPGYMNSYLLEQVIAIKKGIPPHKRKSIYSEVTRRAKIFEKLHKEKGITDFNDLFQILAEARKQRLL